MFVSSLQPVTHSENVSPLLIYDDKQMILSSSSSSSSSSSTDDHCPITDVLSNQHQIIFDKALGQMLTRHFYLTQHEFPSSDRFEGWVYTYNRHRYKVIISYTCSCSCKKFPKYSVCKHFLFVLKRIFNVNLYSFDLRRSLMQYHHLTSNDLEHIFQGQIRRLCPIVTPLTDLYRQEKLPLTLKRQSIDYNDVCPICFERLLMKGKKLVTCFYSCGKSMHETCMKQWKRVQGKATKCPLCQVPWTEPSKTEKAVLDHYTHRSYPNDREQRYILCCLYTPPDWC